MLSFHRTVAFFFWCFLLLHRWALADEEARWGPKATTNNPSEKKHGNYWWTPSLPKIPSLPSLPFKIPFYGGSGGDDETAALTTAAKGLTDPINPSEDQTGSGEGIDSGKSQLLTTLTQGLLVPERRPESLPTETSDPPHSSIVQRDKDAFVSPTSTNTLSTNSPTSSNTRKQNTADTHPPWDTTTVTEPSMGATQRHLPHETSVSQEAEVLSVRSFSAMPPETKAPTSQSWATDQTTTPNPRLVKTTLPMTHALRSATHPTFVRGPKNSTGSTVRPSSVGTMTEMSTTQSQVDQGSFETRSIKVEYQPGVISTTLRIDPKQVGESITSTTQSPRATFPIEGELPDQRLEEEDEDGATSATDEDTSLSDVSTPFIKFLTTSTEQSTGLLPESPSVLLYTEDWLSNLPFTEGTLLPDCNKEESGICNLSYIWDTTPPFGIKPTLNRTATNQSTNPFLDPAPPMLVPLYTDWNSAMAAWGLAWEVHVYGVGCVFAMLMLASALNLLCLPLRCPSGCGYFALVSLFLLAAGCTRSFSLLYDAYGHQDRIPSTEASLVLYEAPFPCLTAAFGLVFLLLSMRSRMQLSYSAFQRPCFLFCLVVLHFTAAFGPVTFLKFYQQKPPLCLLLSLISRGAFVALATFLSVAYFVFYIYVRADSKHIYHLNNTSPTPAERYNRCPFAESRDWNRAAVTVCVSALFSLACSGLQLYAMLNAMGLAGGEQVFHPWTWWAFQFSCRLCELGVCLTLALVVAQPVFCSDQLPAAGSCWTELLASKSPILPGTYQWTLSQQEKLAIVDTVGLGETESLPLYTLMDERLGSSLNGLDLLYHSNRALAYRDLDLDLGLHSSEKPEDGGGREPSGGSSLTSDSTADLRPPSPINLRRSIDEALFSEALFPMSLFSPTRPILCSDMPLNHWTLPNRSPSDSLSADPGLYRTTSCQEMASQNQHPCPPSKEDTGAPASSSMGSSSSCSSPEHWRGSSSSSSLYQNSLGGSSLVLCPSPERHSRHLLQDGSKSHVACSQRHYQTLGAASQESLDLSAATDRSVQEEFISVCRQIDALSICSETIDL
uniref:Proline-rich transmembrane protein 4 n=1 Tax=Nothobranchius kadleci TaxID=1051664 RepID=A0A1A8DZN7_NOTKA